MFGGHQKKKEKIFLDGKYCEEFEGVIYLSIR